MRSTVNDASQSAAARVDARSSQTPPLRMHSAIASVAKLDPRSYVVGCSGLKRIDSVGQSDGSEPFNTDAADNELVRAERFRYLLLKKKMSGQERTTRIHSRNPSTPG